MEQSNEQGREGSNGDGVPQHGAVRVRCRRGIVPRVTHEIDRVRDARPAGVNRGAKRGVNISVNRGVSGATEV